MLSPLKHAGAILLVALCVSCSGVPKKAPRFVAPSTTVIHQATDRLSALQDAQAATLKKLGQAKTIEEARPLILQLGSQIAPAQEQVSILKSGTITLDLQLKTQTDKANQLATDYDKLSVKFQKAEAIVKKVNSWGGIGAIVYGIKRLALRLLFGGIGLAVVWVAVIAFGGGPAITTGLQAVGGLFLRVVTAGRSTKNALDSFKR